MHFFRGELLVSGRVCSLDIHCHLLRFGIWALKKKIPQTSELLGRFFGFRECNPLSNWDDLPNIQFFGFHGTWGGDLLGSHVSWRAHERGLRLGFILPRLDFSLWIHARIRCGLECFRDLSGYNLGGKKCIFLGGTTGSRGFMQITRFLTQKTSGSAKGQSYKLRTRLAAETPKNPLKKNIASWNPAQALPLCYTQTRSNSPCYPNQKNPWTLSEKTQHRWIFSTTTQQLQGFGTRKRQVYCHIVKHKKNRQGRKYYKKQTNEGGRVLEGNPESS